jgi:hypothetical protein
MMSTIETVPLLLGEQQNVLKNKKDGVLGLDSDMPTIGRGADTGLCVQAFCFG